MLNFSISLFLGLLAIWLIIGMSRARIRLKRIDRERQLLEQEKQLLFQFMHNLVAAVGEGHSREALYRRIAHEAIVSSGAMAAALYEKRSGDELASVASEGLFPPQKPLAEDAGKRSRASFLQTVFEPEVLTLGEGLIGTVAAARKALLIPNATHDPRVQQHADHAIRIRSMIIAPILFRDELLGVLAVANRADNLDFNENDFSLVCSLAEQVGLAIQHCDVIELQLEKNKLDVDLELASNIQGMLLGRRFPTVSGLDIAAVYRPARKVGGDLYDSYPLGEGRVGVAIADVSGKGIPASLLMAICLSELGNLAGRHESPAVVLRELNTILEQRMRKDMFITVLYAVIDLAQHTLTFARAGHERPILFEGSTQRISMPASTGMAIGMVKADLFDPAITDKTLPFRPGDALLLYTDGVTESVNSSGEEFGSKRLCEILQRCAQCSAQETIDHIVSDVASFSDFGIPLDDVTLVAVKHLAD